MRVAVLRGSTLRRELGELVRSANPGERLPAERVLTARFGVARETLRRVLDEFVGDGLLERRPGSGTFVSVPKITQRFRLRSFTDDMTSRGMTPSSRLLTASTEPAGEHHAAVFGIGAGDDVLRIRRLRLADGRPMALEDTRMPVRIVADLDPARLADASLYRILDAEYGVRVSGGRQTIEGALVAGEDAKLLERTVPAAVLRIDRVTWDEHRDAIEHTTSLYRADRYAFEVDLSSSGVDR